MRMVKAAVMEGPGKISIQKFPYPSSMDRGLIVKTEYSGICGSDKHTYRGDHIQYGGTEAETSTPFPIIPGHENVGIVEEILNKDGKAKDFAGNELKVGDRITMCPDVVCGECWYCKNTFGYPWCDHNRAYGNAYSTEEKPSLYGGWAEYMYIRPETFIYKVPESVPPEIAVLAEIFDVTFGIDAAKETYSLGNIGFGALPNAVVMGVGPLGLLSIIRLRMMGAGTIIAVDRHEKRLEAAKKFGADITLNINKTTFKERLEIVRQKTGGLGADIVVGCAGEVEAFSEGLHLIRKLGTCIEMGNFIDCGKVDINVSQQICIKNARIIGVGNHPYTEYYNTLKIFERYEPIYHFSEIVSHVYSLNDADDAIKKSMEGDSLKVLIKP